MYTDAELRVIHELIKGLDNNEIAKNIGCAVKTVKFHLHRINKKSKTKTRAEFISQFYRAVLKNRGLNINYKEPGAQMVISLLKSLQAEEEVLPRGKAS